MATSIARLVLVLASLSLALPMPQNAATIDSNTGIYSWDIAGATLNPSGETLYSTQVTIEDLDAAASPVSKSAIDFLIRLVAGPPNQQPQFDSPPTPLSGSSFTVPAGSPLSFAVQASDPDGGDNVRLGVIGLPPGASFPIPAASNPASTIFSWTPPSGQTGDFVVVFTATDDKNLSAPPHSIAISVTGNGFCGLPLIDVYDSTDPNNFVLIGQVKTIQSAETGSSHYDYFSDSGHPLCVDLQPQFANIWMHKNTNDGDLTFSFIFSKDNRAVSNSAQVNFRIVGSTTDPFVSQSDDAGEALETPAGSNAFKGNYTYSDNTDGIAVSGISGTAWTVIIDSVNFGNITNWFAAGGGTSDTISCTDDLSDLILTPGHEYRLTPACNPPSGAPVVAEICNDGIDNDGDGLTDNADPDCNLPDLVVDSLTVSPANPTDQDTLTFRAVVKNQGAGAAGASKLRLEVGGVIQDPEFNVPALNPGQTHTETRQVGALTAQDYLATATADAGQEVTESSETNNVSTLSFTVNRGGTSPRVIRVVDTSGAPGSTVSVPIELVAQGDENGLGFSLIYNPTLLTFSQAVLGNGASGALFNINTNQTGQGRLGIALALPAGQKFAAGTRQIVIVSFTVASGTTTTSTTVGFGDQPIGREVVDANANVLPATHADATVTVTGPALAVAKAGTGSGMVTSSPAGINCGSDCTESYSSGTVVTLTATPASGSNFAGWTDACSGTGPCTLTLDSAKTATAIFVTPLTMGASALEGEVGVAYNACPVSGGLLPYTVSVTKGTLPPGLSLDSGCITGTLTKAGNASFTVQVTDDLGSSVSKKVSMKVLKAVSIATKSLGKGKVGKKYTAALRVTGGKKPYVWSLVSGSGSLPGGLSLDPSTSKITGTPIESGSFNLTLQVTDALGGTASKRFSLNIN